MVDHICENCTYYNPQGWHICECPKMIYGYYGQIPLPDAVLVEDDEGWGMKPGPKFGCIHWGENGTV